MAVARVVEKVSLTFLIWFCKRLAITVLCPNCQALGTAVLMEANLRLVVEGICPGEVAWL